MTSSIDQLSPLTPDLKPLTSNHFCLSIPFSNTEIYKTDVTMKINNTNLTTGINSFSMYELFHQPFDVTPKTSTETRNS